MEYIGQNKNADEIIRSELTRAGIEVIEVEPYSDNKTDGCVLFNLGGRLKTTLGDITFHRNWYYWVVKGKVSLYHAQLLYRNPEGRISVRVGGHCGCPSPDEYGIDYMDDEGYILASIAEWEQYPKDGIIWGMVDQETMITKNGLFKLVDDPHKQGKPYVNSYHIDSQAGLLLFAEVLKGNLDIK